MKRDENNIPGRALRGCNRSGDRSLLATTGRREEIGAPGSEERSNGRQKERPDPPGILTACAEE